MQNSFFMYIKLMRLNKPIGWLLLLWPTLWAIFLTKNPTIFFTIIFIIGVIIMRSAGCVINDIADRKFDGYVERTKNRPLTNGQISVKNALILFVILIVIALCLLFLLPPISWFVACFAFLFTCIYPFMKRITYLPQVILGIAFSCSIPMVYGAFLSSFPATCWLLFLSNLLWTVAYDTEYAMVDREDDLKIGVKSIAILFGRFDKLSIALLQIATVVLLIVIGVINDLSYFFYVGLLSAIVLFCYQHLLISKREKECCFKAFLNNNLVGLAIFIGILADYLSPISSIV